MVENLEVKHDPARELRRSGPATEQGAGGDEAGPRRQAERAGVPTPDTFLRQSEVLIWLESARTRWRPAAWQAPEQP